MVLGIRRRGRARFIARYSRIASFFQLLRLRISDLRADRCQSVWLAGLALSFADVDGVDGVGKVARNLID
jgi:hypothetical protein